MLSFVDKQFDLNETSQYKLSIQIYLGGFLFCVTDANDNCIAARAISFSNVDDLANAIILEPLMRKDFSEVRCIVENKLSTLIPANIFDEKHTATYLDFVCKVDDENEIFHRKIEALNAECVFAANKNICNEIRKHQPNAQFYNQAIALINSALAMDGKNVFVCFGEKILDIVAVENQKLLFHNTFNIESLADAEYYTALAIQQLDIVPDKIFLSGKIGREECNDLKKIFSQTELEIDQNLMFALGGENALKVITLIKLCQCE